MNVSGTKSGFANSGHLPTLIAALLYFDVSFMVWVVLGPLAPFLRDELHLTATQQGLVVAVPLLGGSFFRPILGTLGDRIGQKRTGVIGLCLTIVPLAIGWSGPTSVAWLYAIGLMLGIAGASFAVALPLASRWYPPEYQGVVLGIAGAGNSGSLLATLFAPRLVERVGWAHTLGLAIVPVLAVTVLFVLLAKESPVRRRAASWSEYAGVLKEPDTFWFAFLYSLTFGGFVGFTSFLPTFFREQYHVSRVSAGDFTTMVVIAGSFMRPVGGWISDRIGGYRLLMGLLLAIDACLLTVASLPPLPIVLPLLFVSLALLGMGNGAIFQLVPQRFADRIGIVTGIVGAAGGLGGFFLPTILGFSRDVTGSYRLGLLMLALVFFAGTLALLELGVRWSRHWGGTTVKQLGIFCYRLPERRRL